MVISGRTSHSASNSTRPSSCPPVTSISRRGDEVDVVLADGLAEVAGNGVTQRLLAGGAETDAGLEHPSRRLAVAEAGQLDLSGDRLER